MQRIISILIENEPGALSRVTGLFSARGYNIQALTVAPTEDETLSRITMITIGDDRVIEQIVKQLNKLIDIIKVSDITESNHIVREIMLIKFRFFDESQKQELYRLVGIYKGSIIDVCKDIYTVQIIGDNEKLDSFIYAVNNFKIIEIVRSGSVGISRGSKSLTV